MSGTHGLALKSVDRVGEFLEVVCEEGVGCGVRGVDAGGVAEDGDDLVYYFVGSLRRHALVPIAASTVGRGECRRGRCEDRGEEGELHLAVGSGEGWTSRTGTRLKEAFSETTRGMPDYLYAYSLDSRVRAELHGCPRGDCRSKSSLTSPAPR